MTKRRLPPSLLVLQWVLGLVLLWESLHFAFSSGAAVEFARTGLPNLIRIVLAWAETAAVLFFLTPRTTVAGGRLLLLVLVAAIVLHLLHGWYNVGALVVYAAATWAVIANKQVGSSAEGQP